MNLRLPKDTEVYLHTYCDLELPSNSEYVYASKANKEVGRRFEQASTIVTATSTHHRRARNPAELGHVISTSLCVPAAP